MKASYQRALVKNCFNNKEVFEKAIKVLPIKQAFSDEMANSFWELFVYVHSKGKSLSFTSVEGILTEQKREDLVEDFRLFIKTVYEDELEWVEHLKMAVVLYQKSFVVSVSRFMMQNINEIPVEKILQQVRNDIEHTLSKKEATHVNSMDAVSSTIDEILARQGVESLIKTGVSEIDDLLDVRQIIIVAAMKKIGKTKFLIQLVKNICLLMEKVSIQWHSYEMNHKDLIINIISNFIELTEKEIKGKSGYKLSEKEIRAIRNAATVIAEWPIEYQDKPMNIFDLSAKFKNFCRNKTDTVKILLIDNLGLIVPHDKFQNKVEEDIMRELAKIRDEQDALIIVLHHLNKDASKKDNLETGFMPDFSLVRGNERIMDYCNQVWLLHRPGFFSQLMDEAKQFLSDEEMSLLKRIFLVHVAINRSGPTKFMRFFHELEFNKFHYVDKIEE